MTALDWAMGKPKKKDGVVVQQVNSGSDCTAFTTADMADDLDGLLFILNAVNERIPLGENAPRLAEVCRIWEPQVVAGDDDNLSTTMLLETRRFSDIPTIKCLPIKGKNKLTRSQAAIVRAERGMILLPEDEEEWLEPFADQLAAFTGADGEPDDTADTVSILGRLADEFRPGEDVEEYEPDVVGGFDGSGVWG